MTPTEHQPPREGEAGFGRDQDLETARRRTRPAESDLSSNKAKAEQEPTIDYAPDPDDEG